MVLDSKIDTSVAEAYESALVATISRPWAEAIVAHVGITPGARVLDVACGTGIGARCVARLLGTSGEVVGVDCDAGMIETAKYVAEQEGVSAEYRVGSASDLPFSSATFDMALCLQGFQYFPDRAAAMAELHRVLKPNAKIAIATWGELENCKGPWALVRALERRSIDAAAARHPYLLSDRNSIRTLAAAAGFQKIEIRTEQQCAQFSSTEAFVNAMTKGSTSTRLALAKIPLEDWPDFLSEVDAELAQWRHGDSLALPMENNILEARC
jgi:SAM-dependent methyltransferase